MYVPGGKGVFVSSSSLPFLSPADSTVLRGSFFSKFQHVWFINAMCWGIFSFITDARSLASLHRRRETIPPCSTLQGLLLLPFILDGPKWMRHSCRWHHRAEVFEKWISLLLSPSYTWGARKVECAEGACFCLFEMLHRIVTVSSNASVGRICGGCVNSKCRKKSSFYLCVFALNPDFCCCISPLVGSGGLGQYCLEKLHWDSVCLCFYFYFSLFFSELSVRTLFLL